MSFTIRMSGLRREAIVLALSGAILATVATAAEASLVISAGTTTNISCSSGVCSATARNAVLNVGDLESMLSSSGVTVKSTSRAGDIKVAAALTWASSSSLTLDAFHSTEIDSRVSDTGPGGLTLLTDDGGAGGTLSFGPKGNVTFFGLTNNLTINGTAYGLVNTIAKLAHDIATHPSGHFALSKSYNATRDGTYSSSPVPTTFSGNFNGLGNTINNLSINSGDTYTGLFAFLGVGGTIGNLHLTKVAVEGNSSNLDVGALVGKSEGQITDVTVAGSVTGSGDVIGGLVGDNGGTGALSTAQSAAMVTDNDTADVFAYVGGLVGASYNSISNSSATNSVTETAGSDSDIGGLVGWNNGGSVISSFATGNVTTNSDGDFDDVGGLAGRSGYTGTSTISSSYATGIVNGGGFEATVGGLAGAVTQTSSVTGSQASGNATGNGQYAFVGGLVGDVTDTTGTVSAGQAAGAVTGGADSDDGGLVGANAGTVSGTASGSVTGGAGSCTGPLIGYPNNTQPGCE